MQELLNRPEKYLITPESSGLIEAAGQDPFGLRDVMGEVPAALNRGDAGFLTAELRNIGGIAVQAFDRHREMTPGMLVSLLSSADLVSCAATKALQAQGETEVDVIDRVPDVLPAFLIPAERLRQSTSRCLVSSYIAFDPGTYSFTGNKIESSFAASIREAYLASDYALQRLSSVNLLSIVSSADEFNNSIECLSDVTKALSVLWDAQCMVEKDVPIDFFDFHIQPNFVQLNVKGESLYAQGAAHLPLLAAEHILRGIDAPIDNDKYWEHFNKSRPYLTAHQEALLQLFIDRNGMSFLGMARNAKDVASGYQMSHITSSIFVPSVINALREIDKWRAKHLRWVKDSFRDNRPEDATGSAGSTVEDLSGIYHELRRPRSFDSGGVAHQTWYD